MEPLPFIPRYALHLVIVTHFTLSTHPVRLYPVFAVVSPISSKTFARRLVSPVTVIGVRRDRQRAISSICSTWLNKISHATNISAQLVMEIKSWDFECFSSGVKELRLFVCLRLGQNGVLSLEKSSFHCRPNWFVITSCVVIKAATAAILLGGLQLRSLLAFVLKGFRKYENSSVLDCEIMGQSRTIYLEIYIGHNA
jgi:hypothetical protein